MEKTLNNYQIEANQELYKMFAQDCSEMNYSEIMEYVADNLSSVIQDIAVDFSPSDEKVLKAIYKKNKNEIDKSYADLLTAYNIQANSDKLQRIQDGISYYIEAHLELSEGQLVGYLTDTFRGKVIETSHALIKDLMSKEDFESKFEDTTNEDIEEEVQAFVKKLQLTAKLQKELKAKSPNRKFAKI